MDADMITLLETMLDLSERLVSIEERMDQQDAKLAAWIAEQDVREARARQAQTERLDQMAALVGAKVGLDAKTVQRPEKISERLAALEASGNAFGQIADLREEVKDLWEVVGRTPTTQEILARIKATQSRRS